jgi:signal transduction histidine kinase
MQRRLREAERRTVVERERSRIARDIHDDLGAGMAQIAMLCGLARRAAPGSELQGARLQEIAARAEEGMRRLREIVWAVDPAYDGIEHLVVQLAASAEEHLQLAGIAFRAEIPPRLPESEFTAAVRHQLALAVREAVHNAVRHGRPGCVTLRVVPARRELVIEVIDDGCGCDADAALAAGRGVANLDRRLRALGGRCRFVSTPGSGTTVRFTVPIPDHARANHGHHPTRRPSPDHGGGGGGRSRPARRPPGLPG